MSWACSGSRAAQDRAGDYRPCSRIGLLRAVDPLRAADSSPEPGETHASCCCLHFGYHERNISAVLENRFISGELSPGTRCGCGQMVASVNAKKLGQRCAVAVLIAGLCFSASSISQVAAQPDILEHVSGNSALQPAVGEAAEVRQALMVFIRSMAQGDATTVWTYASEEDQAAFQSEDAVLAAFKDAFPALTTAKELRFDIVRQEGDTPFSSVTFKDEFDKNYQAEIEL